MSQFTLNAIFNYKSSILLAALLVNSQGCGGGSDSSGPPAPPTPPPVEEVLPLLSVSTTEVGSAIYLDGIYTGQVTPADVSVAAGEHTVGIGLKDSSAYLKKSVTVEDTTDAQSISLNNDDLQAPKEWKALFIGANSVQAPNVSCTSEYTTTELDAGYDFFKWSFTERVEDYSYNTTDWTFDRFDIVETVTLSGDKLITPSVIESYLSDNNIFKGDYDLIVTFFRGGAVLEEAGSATGQDCYIEQFNGIAWFNYDVLSVQSTYVTIRYWDNAIEAIDYSKADEKDPGMFIHEWLHSVAEVDGKNFFQEQGSSLPSNDNQVVHAAGAFDYEYPWMTWYQDLITGQVKSGNDYKGITPEKFLACSVREDALGQCD